MRGLVREWVGDFRAVARNDPAARSGLETALAHTPLHAIWIHRVAHRVQRAGLRLPARLLATLARFWSGVEIHPAAEIGERFFIDHGSGVVIGETAQVGSDCVLFHNVTLGGTGKHEGKRHPTLGDGVYVGTGATLLGPIRVGDRAKIGAGSFVRMRDVPAGCTAVGTPARMVKRDGVRVEEELPRTLLSEATRPASAQASGVGQASAAGARSEPPASGVGPASAAGARSEPQASGVGPATLPSAEPPAEGAARLHRAQEDS